MGNAICDFPPKLTFKTEDLEDDQVSQKDVNMLYPKDWTQEQAEERLFALGHPRFNNHFGLVLIQTFWVREHNNICDLLVKIIQIGRMKDFFKLLVLLLLQN